MMEFRDVHLISEHKSYSLTEELVGWRSNPKEVEMRRARLTSVYFLILICGCSAGTEKAGRQQTGVNACDNDGDCGDFCPQLVYQVPISNASPMQFADSKCEKYKGIVAPVTGKSPQNPCLCFISENKDVTVAGSSNEECAYYGRNRHCIYGREEYPGCDPDAQDSGCSDVCADLAGRIENDNTADYHDEIRMASCSANRAVCNCVFQIDGNCYVASSRTPYDCNLTNEQMISAYEQELAKAEDAVEMPE